MAALPEKGAYFSWGNLAFICALVWIVALIDPPRAFWAGQVRQRIDRLTEGSQDYTIEAEVRSVFGADITGVCVVSPSRPTGETLLNARDFTEAAHKISRRDHPGYDLSEARNYLYLYILHGEHLEQRVLKVWDGPPSDGRLWSGRTSLNACYRPSDLLTIVAAQRSGAFEFPSGS